jgi:tetratricopeptide (TPR) repeat protein
MVIANFALVLPYYYAVFADSFLTHPRVSSFLAMVAVFPIDFFHGYFRDQWLVHVSWMVLIVICAFGILLLNKFARAVFIVLNVIHMTVLSYIVILHHGQGSFLDFFFKGYFNMVAAISYVGFLTLPEIREQFNIELEGLRLKIWLERPLNKKPLKSDVNRYESLSVAYVQLGRFEEALDALEKAISVDPGNANLHFQVGMIHIRMNRYPQAARALQESVRLNPIHYEANYNLGSLFMREGSAKEAAEFFLKATHIQPKKEQAYRDLGDAYMSLKRYEDACASFKEAIALSSKDSYSYLRLGVILGQFLNNPQEAFEALRTSVRLDPQCFESQFEFAKASFSMGRFKDAVRGLKEADRLNPENPSVCYYLGLSYAKLNDHHSALRQHALLKERDPALAGELMIMIHTAEHPSIDGKDV